MIDGQPGDPCRNFKHPAVVVIGLNVPWSSPSFALHESESTHDFNPINGTLLSSEGKSPWAPSSVGQQCLSERDLALR